VEKSPPKTKEVVQISENKKKERPHCPSCGKPMEEVIDKIAGKKTGYLWRCKKCMPENVSISIG